jgi:GxxExxY protein
VENEELTSRIIACAYKVHRILGAGFLEKVYENAMKLELTHAGLAAQQQFCLPVFYRGEKVGEYYADLFVENQFVCELKACEALSREHEVQLVNYLAATGLDSGLLINFGKSVVVKRKFRQYQRNEVNVPVNPEKSC